MAAAKETAMKCSLQQADVLGASLTEAIDLFVMTKFDPCFQLCCDIISTAKSEPEHERNEGIIETATALGIQALGESDQWQRSIGFITEVYGTITQCPAKIIQVCILLHAHVEEYLPCHALLHAWLSDSQNTDNGKMCAKVLKVYSKHILAPTGQLGRLEVLMRQCKSIEQVDRDALLALPQSGRYKVAKTLQTEHPTAHSALETAEELNSPSGDGTPHLPHSPSDWSSPGQPECSWCPSEGGRSVQARSAFVCSDCLDGGRKKLEEKNRGTKSFLATCIQLYSAFLRNVKSSWRQKFAVVLMFFFGVWALMQSQSGDPVSSLGRVVTLWQNFFQRFKLLLSR